jgi:hypothetical protein
MFVVTTALAVVLSGLFAGPAWLAYVTAILLAVAAPMVLTVVLIYGRGYARTFCVGALFPLGVLLSALGSGFLTYPFYGRGPFGRGPSVDEEARLYIGFALVIASIVIVAFGLLAMGTRWMVEQSRAGRLGPASSKPAEPVDLLHGESPPEN